MPAYESNGAESSRHGSASERHSWDVSTAEARRCNCGWPRGRWTGRSPAYIETVAGADVSYELRGKWLYAAVVVVKAGTWEVIDRSGVIAEAKFPYVPGLLSFREAPPVIEALRS